MSGLQYPDRPKTLATDRLEQRGLKADLRMYCKIIIELVDLPVDEFFCFKQSVTRNNGATIYLNSFRFNAERYYFKNRWVSHWYSLATYVVKSKSLNDFKRCLDGTVFNNFL